MAEGDVLYERREKIGLITLNRPEKKNAFTREMIDLWSSYLDNARSDRDVRVVLLTGKGDTFCSGGDVREMAEGKLWEHSMNCGLSAWMVATKVGYSDLETAFVAGMMHDVGKVVLDEFLFEENQKFADMTKRQALTTAEAERAIFGIDHAEAGSRIAEKWNFSDKVVEAIKYHHQPEQAINEPDLTTIVYFADFVCVSLGITTDMSIFMQNFEGPHLSSAG